MASLFVSFAPCRAFAIQTFPAPFRASVVGTSPCGLVQSPQGQPLPGGQRMLSLPGWAATPRAQARLTIASRGRSRRHRDGLARGRGASVPMLPAGRRPGVGQSQAMRWRPNG